jgi:hypothetical protein
MKAEDLPENGDPRSLLSSRRGGKEFGHGDYPVK